MSGRTAVFGIFVCIFIYLALSLEYLDLFPKVGQDEPWIAAAPYKLATQGILGSDLFAGYYGIERHNYQHMPLFPLLQALVFRLSGVGLFQMRLLPVAFGLLLLVTTYLVGRQVGGVWTGVLAALLMVGLSLGSRYDETGIPLLDSARINRYDIAVPVFGLLALWKFNRIEADQQNGKSYLLVGLLIGLSALSHLYGIFWLPTLWAIGFLRHGRRYWRQPAPYLIVAGIGVAFLPWLLFIASGWQDFLGQTRFVADRIEIFNPNFYVNNLLHEIDRYQRLEVESAQSWLYLVQPGTWRVILATVVALVLLVWQARNQSAIRSRYAVALAVAIVMQSLLFALLLKVKSYNYVIALWPLAVLALAWLGVWMWQQSAKWWMRGMLLALLGLLLFEGAGRINHRRVVAAAITPYEQLTAQIDAMIPPDARVLGLQHYWLGLYHHPYRSWLLPVLYALPEYYAPQLTMDAALERVDPDVILLDDPMQSYFDEIADAAHPNHALYRGYQEYMETHHVTLLGVIEDGSYGRLAIYRIED